MRKDTGRRTHFLNGIKVGGIKLLEKNNRTTTTKNAKSGGGWKSGGVK